jgi:hypothetical protein
LKNLSQFCPFNNSKFLIKKFLPKRRNFGQSVALTVFHKTNTSLFAEMEKDVSNQVSGVENAIKVRLLER